MTLHLWNDYTTRGPSSRKSTPAQHAKAFCFNSAMGVNTHRLRLLFLCTLILGKANLQGFYKKKKKHRTQQNMACVFLLAK